MSPKNIERQMRNSELLLIKKDGEYISGDIIVYEGTIPACGF